MTAIHRDTPEYDLHVTFANLTLELARIHDTPGFTQAHERANQIQAELDKISRDLKRSNDYGLTVRETQVLQLLAHGHTNETIGGILSISPETVRTHIRKAMERMGAKTRVQAVAVAASVDLFTVTAPDPATRTNTTQKLRDEMRGRRERTITERILKAL